MTNSNILNEKTVFIERDISWLSFNYRVLQEAMDLSVPLYERIKFLAIYSSNLDEFFRVRVASLRSFKELKKKTRKKLNIRPKKSLKVIHKMVGEQQEKFGEIFWEEIIPQLEKGGVHLINDTQFSESQKAEAKTIFEEKIKEFIKPVFISADDDQNPFLKNKGLYFIVEFEEEETPFALVEIPSENCDRFYTFSPDKEQFWVTFLDDILKFNLPSVFEGKSIKGAYSVKVSRDAEMYIDDEYSGDLLEKIRNGLQERDIGLPTRFLYDSTMPTEIVDRIKTILNLSKYDLIPGARYHNFNDFFAFPDPTNNPDWHDEKLPPMPVAELENADSLLAKIAEKDFMLHFPYQKYDYVPQLIWEAANDPNVESIKITLYRVASKSAVTKALLHAVEKGKKVFAFIEAKARFDEASNLFWGGKLAEAGATVRYSYPGIKVHTKLLIINRKEGDLFRNYAYLGTGNFNEKTSKLYADHALFTVNPKLTNEVSQVFQILEGKILIPKTKHLLVSPFTSRKGFNKLIDNEIVNAKAGKEAYMILKMNSLEDPKIMSKLIEASQAGVKIQMIVRGICCLVPGIKGLTENIEIRSIIDRFLEHARVYIFCNGGKEKMFTASADWMTRNLDRRVEVVIPIYDKEVYQELREIINIQWRDNVKSRIIDEGQENHYKNANNEEKSFKAQLETYRFLS